MLFRYNAITDKGETKEGKIDAVNKDLAVAALQRRSLIIVSIKGDEEKSLLQISLFEKVPMKDVVILSRQISTLFDAQVSALKAFTLLSTNTENKLLGRKLAQVVDDLKAGFSISGALSKHSEIFSDFYINMVKAGEESGKLNQTFAYLADYLDREYELTSKTKNALVYPAFVIVVFIVVMVLMFVMVIPKLSAIILESGQAVPVYTKVVIAISNFFVNNGVLFLIGLIIAGFAFWRFLKSGGGKEQIDSLKISAPVVGNLFKKLYLSRIADNLDTMLSSGITIVRAIEVTGEVVGNKVYARILKEAGSDVKTGSSLSASLARHKEMPGIMVQMVQVGEETGALSSILKTLAKFYKREVDDAVDTLVGLIEPVMIVVLGLGVGLLLTSVLMPIYNISSSIN